MRTMRHQLPAEQVSSGGLLQVVLLLGSIFAAACDENVQCPQNLGNWTSTVVFTDGLNVGSTAKFLCPQGLYPWPQNRRTCLKTGKWTDIKNSYGKKLKEISCKKIRCPDPDIFENGEFNPRGPFYIDSNITFMCNDGYIPRGSMVRICKKNGKWSGETAICDNGAGHCPDPGLPPGAMKTGIRYDIDDSVKYKCVSGLTLIGSSTRTCLDNRRWSGNEVTCQFPYTFDLPEEAGEFFAGSLSGIVQYSERKEQVGRTVKINNDGILNVYILLDASSSVGEETFDIFKECAEMLVIKLGRFDMKIEFGVISFATEPKVIVRISNEDEIEDVLDLFDTDLKYSDHRDKSGTNTYAALRQVYEMMAFQEQKYKKNPAKWNSIHHVIVLLTDGKANMGGRPVEMIKKINEYLNISKNREDHLDVYAFGIGEDTDKTELNELASQKENEKHVFILDTADDMKTAFQEITSIKDYGEMCGLNDETDESATSLSYPWNVKIGFGKTSPCFGSLISSRWVLSAAHCFTNSQNPDGYTFEIGDTSYKPEGIFIHDCYDLRRKSGRGIPQDFDYDVALVKLKEKVKFSISARPICLPCTEPANRAMKKRKDASCDEHRAFLQKGSDVMAEFLSRDRPKKELKKMEVYIKYDNLREACVSAIKGFDTYKNITPHDMASPRHLCVQGEMSCKGESGGSLFVNPNKRRFFQVGVLSFGTFDPCETAKRKTSFANYARDFYIDLLQVLPWLHEHLKDDIEFQPGTEIKEVVCPS
ncbi:complement C2-like [Anomaloglossus baeobatrachus]|uniref:complement C2-like n=1 Tax=Anomaloglossus baeobatrachus TaxID=238106 RepID=UPI003F50BE50